MHEAMHASQAHQLYTNKYIVIVAYLRIPHHPKRAVHDDWLTVACAEGKSTAPLLLADPSCTRAFRHLNKPAPARRRQNNSITKRVPNPPNHRLYAHHSNAPGTAKLLIPISVFIERVEGRKSGPEGLRP
jgi:hypothetical protein